MTPERPGQQPVVCSVAWRRPFLPSGPQERVRPAAASWALSGHCAHARVCACTRVCVPVTGVCTCASASRALCGRPVPVVLWSPRRSLRRLPAPGAQAPAGPRLAGPSVAGALLCAVRRGRHCPRWPGSPAAQCGSRPSVFSVAVGTVGLGPALVLSVLCLHLLGCRFISPFLLSFGLFLFFFRVPFEIVYWRLAFHEVFSW